MFTGTFTHSLDAKGRLTLPKDFRELLGEGAFLGPGNDGCLAVWPAEGWQQVAQRQRTLMQEGSREERHAARIFFGQAQPVEPDAQGRIAIAANLRQDKGIDKEVVSTGAYDYVEIWPMHEYRRMFSEGSQAIAEGRIQSFGM
jgi:MraZ protein